MDWVLVGELDLKRWRREVRDGFWEVFGRF